MPPLRERKEDIASLCSHFLQSISVNLSRPGLGLSEKAIRRLQDYDWPGNVRELENVLERAAVLCEGNRIEDSDLPLLTTGSLNNSSVMSDHDLVLVPTLEKIEKQYIERALQRANGVKTEAAKLLGVKTSALYYKLEKYGLLE
jgi:two-component system response regulator HydG